VPMNGPILFYVHRYLPVAAIHKLARYYFVMYIIIIDWLIFKMKGMP